MDGQQFFPIGSYCSSTVWGGLEMNVLNFLVWMRERGWPVFLYARPDTPLAQHAFEQKIPLRPVPAAAGISALWNAGKLARPVTNDQLKVLIVHQSRDLLLCALVRQRAGEKPKLIFSQNMHLGNKRDMIHAWQYRRLDAFVAPVAILAKQARRQTVVPPEKIHIIPHGIESDRFSHRPDRSESRCRLNLPLEPTIIGIIGRLDPKKGQHLGIQALAKLHTSGVQPHLLIVGDPTLDEKDGYQKYLLGLVDELKLKDFVHFRPYQQNPETGYGAIDIFVLTSQSETYGLVTIEAMTAGLPVIGTASGGTVNLIDNGRTGLLFPPDDPETLSQMLLRYLRDPEYAARLADAGRGDALARYSHTTQCASWEKLIRSL